MPGSMEGATALDAALRAAKNDQSRVSNFYEVLLDTELLLPTKDGAPAPGAPRGATMGLRLFTMQVDGHTVVPVFDTEDRLHTWAEIMNVDPKPIRMTGEELFLLIDGHFRVALNVATDAAHVFKEQEVQWFHDQIVAMQKR